MLQGVVVKNPEAFTQHCQDWFLSVLLSFLFFSLSLFFSFLFIEGDKGNNSSFLCWRGSRLWQKERSFLRPPCQAVAEGEPVLGTSVHRLADSFCVFLLDWPLGSPGTRSLCHDRICSQDLPLAFLWGCLHSYLQPTHFPTLFWHFLNDSRNIYLPLGFPQVQPLLLPLP